FHGNFIDVVMFLYKVNYNKALNIIANDFGIIDKPHYNKNLPRIKYDGVKIEEGLSTILQCKVRDFVDTDLKWWSQFGITQDILEKFKVFPVEHIFLNGNYLSSPKIDRPAYGYYFGKQDGIEQWKVYFPNNDSFR